MKARHKSVLSLFTLLCLTSACAFLTRPFKGGTYLVLNVKSDPAQLDQNIAQTITVLRKRCDLLRISCNPERLGEHSSQIKLHLSSSTDPEHVKRILLTQGEELELRAVVSPPSPSPVQTYNTQAEAATAAGADKDVLPYTERSDNSRSANRFVVVERTPIVTGKDIRRAEASPSYDKVNYQINFSLNPEGAQRLGAWTGAHINDYIAVVLNKEARSIAYIKGQIYDEAQITGHFTKQQAEDVAMLLMSGSLPASVEAVEEGTDKS